MFHCQLDSMSESASFWANLELKSRRYVQHCPTIFPRKKNCSKNLLQSKQAETPLQPCLGCWWYQSVKFLLLWRPCGPGPSWYRNLQWKDMMDLNTSKPFKALGSHFLNVFCGVLIPSIFGALQLFFCACHLQFCELPHVSTLKHKAQSAHGGSRMLMVLRLLNLEGVFVLEDLRRTIKHSPKEGGVAFYDELWL